MASRPWLNHALTKGDMMEIQVIIKDQYGAVAYHPNNQAASLLAEIAGTKTLTPRVLRLAQDMGYTVFGVPHVAASNCNYMPVKLAF